MAYRYKRQQPDLLKGVQVSDEELKTLESPLGSWSPLHRWLMGFRGEHRTSWEKKALMAEFNQKQRKYIIERLVISIRNRENEDRKSTDQKQFSEALGHL